MIEVEKTLRYQEAEREKARRRWVARTAEALAIKLRIAPYERCLVCCLGSGGERNNLEALRIWVDARFQENDEPDLRRLSEELNKHLWVELGDPAWN